MEPHIVYIAYFAPNDCSAKLLTHAQIHDEMFTDRVAAMRFARERNKSNTDRRGRWRVVGFDLNAISRAARAVGSACNVCGAIDLPLNAAGVCTACLTDDTTPEPLQFEYNGELQTREEWLQTFHDAAISGGACENDAWNEACSEFVKLCTPVVPESLRAHLEGKDTP